MTRATILPQLLQPECQYSATILRQPRCSCRCVACRATPLHRCSTAQWRGSGPPARHQGVWQGGPDVSTVQSYPGILYFRQFEEYEDMCRWQASMHFLRSLACNGTGFTWWMSSFSSLPSPRPSQRNGLRSLTAAWRSSAGTGEWIV